jgi:hypothetical protein
MSRRAGIWGVSSSLLNALDWCKRTRADIGRFFGGIVWSTTPVYRHPEVKGRQSTKVGHPVQIYFCGERIECKKFLKH